MTFANEDEVFPSLDTSQISKVEETSSLVEILEEKTDRKRKSPDQPVEKKVIIGL